MHYLEQEVRKYRRRVEKIRNNPDPTKLQANRLLYELCLEDAEIRWQWHLDNKPFAFADIAPPPPFLLAMGMQTVVLASDADKLGPNAAPYLDLGKRFRYHESLCDRVLAGQGLALSDDYVRPSFVAACNYPCTPHTLAMASIGEHYHVPTFAIDMPDEYTPDTIGYMVEQFEELISLAETKMPNVKYDESQLAEIIANQKGADRILTAIQDLKTHVPSPVSGVDVIRIPSFFPHNPRKSLDYLQTYLDEMNERVAKGIFPVPNEKVRLAWTVSAPLFTENVWNFLHKNDVSMVYYDAGGENLSNEPMLAALGYPTVSTLLGREATPLEQVAGDMCRFVWSGRVERRVANTILWCQRYQLDGIVHFQQSGCPMGSSTAQLLAERVEQALGIPSLLLDGRMLDKEWYDETQVFSQLEEFFQLCESAKQIRLSQHSTTAG